MKLSALQLIGLSVLSGLLLGIAFPFTGGLFPLAFVAFVPLLLVNFDLNNMNRGRFWARFGLNMLAFIIFNFITSWWIYFASGAGMYLAVLALAVMMTLPMMFTGFVSRQLGENKGIIAFLVIWMAYEWCQYYWDTSHPWMNLGHMFGEYPKLIQWYEYSGVTGGTMWILIVNIFIYLIIRNLWWRKENLKVQFPIFLFTGIAIVFPIVSSLTIYYTYEEEENPIEVVVVQPNVEAHTEKFVVPVDIQLMNMFRLAQTEITPTTDLVICPETALPSGTMDQSTIDDHRLVQWIKTFSDSNYRVPWLIGADTYKLFNEPNSSASKPVNHLWYESYNTALMIGVNRPTQIHNKSKLVLGGEKIPFIDYLSFLKDYSVELGGTSGVLGVGTEIENLEAKGLFYAPLICYESVYGDYTSYYVRKGAEIICVITNDGWWADTPGYKQHRMFSRIRAIENRRSVARSANTGISCLIDQRGDIIEEIGWDEEGVIHGIINKNTEFTFFTKYGDLIGRISAFMALIFIIYAFVEFVKKIKVDKAS